MHCTLCVFIQYFLCDHIIIAERRFEWGKTTSPKLRFITSEADIAVTAATLWSFYYIKSKHLAPPLIAFASGS